MLFSLAPALRALRLDLTDSLKDGGQSASSGGARQRFRNALVVAEMALAVVLLVGAGLMLRSLWSLQRVPLGLDPTNVLTMRVALPQTSYPSTRTGRVLLSANGRSRATAAGRSGRRRGARAAARFDDRRLRARRSRVTFRRPAPTPRATGRSSPTATSRRWASGSFAAVASRRLTRANSMLVALINEEMARRYWSGRDAIGGRFASAATRTRPWVTVVGIVADVRHNGLTGAVKEKFYVPHPQWHKATGIPIRGDDARRQDIGRSGSAGGADPSGDSRDGPEPCRLRTCARWPTCVGSTLSTPRFTGMLLRDLRCAGVGALRDWHLRRAVVSRQPSDARDRDSRRDRRGPRRGAAAGAAAGALLALAGVVIGMASRRGSTPDARPAARRHAGRSADVRHPSALALSLVAILASLVPAWRATRVDPVVALKTE